MKETRVARLGDDRLLQRRVARRRSYPYFHYLPSTVLPLDNLGVVAVSGYRALDIYLDTETFLLSCNSVIGPFAFARLPLEGDDVGAIIDGHQDQLPMVSTW